MATSAVSKRLSELEAYFRTVYKPYGWLSDAQWRRLAESSVRRTADGRVTPHYDPPDQPFRMAPMPQSTRSIVVPLRRPTADTTELTNAALMGLKAIYQPGYKLAKAGVMLLDLIPDTVVQGELGFEDAVAEQRDRYRLMVAMDQVNDRFGKRTLLLGSSGIKQGADTWGMKQVRRTPRYTTDWDQVAVARA